MSCTITTLDEDDSSVRRIWAVVVQDRNRYALLSSAQLDRGLQQEYLRKLGSSAVDELQARLASLDQASAAFLLGTPVDRSLLDFSNASTNRFMLRCGKQGREDELEGEGSSAPHNHLLLKVADLRHALALAI